MKQTRQAYDYGQVLMWAAVLVSMPRWAGAFIAADVSDIPPIVDQVLHYMNLASGFGMALLEVVGAAYLLDAWGRMKPKRTHNAKSYDHRWVVLTCFVGGLFLLMPLILAPYVVSRMITKAIADIGGGLFHFAWSVAVVMSPIFIVGGVAVARDGLVGVKETAVIKPEISKPEPARKRRDSGILPGILPTDWRQLSHQQKHSLASSTREERENIFPELADRTRREWHNRLDKIAAQNGNYVV